MQKYDHQKIEKKWQKRWEETSANKIDKDDTSKPKFYLLDMYPYPSGDGLHMGHTEAYTANDIFSRYKKANGFNVLHPTGFDSFGLPAENYAVKTGVHPKETTTVNCSNFTKQLKTLGIDYDYDEMITTSDPSYYKWTQWLFVQFFKNNLVYKKTDTVNWCDSCKTVLANEQVEGGLCERCKNEVVQKQIPSWFFKITDFAQDLIDGHEKIDWPEHTRKNQINWIGKSEGAELSFDVAGSGEKIVVFTTRPDTLFGATYMVLSPEHELVEKLKDKIENAGEVSEYVKAASKKTDLERTVETKEKTGVELKGAKAINPANEEEIPIYIADYVLAHYGTGAIMAVPSHDERDWEFAEKFNLPMPQVVAPCFVREEGEDALREDEPVEEREAITAIVKHWSEEKYIVLKWKKVDWHTFITGGVEEGQTPEEAARAEVLEETGYKNLRLVKELGRFHAKFFHVPKGVNRFAHFHTFYFELENNEKDDVTKEEQENHDILWLNQEELVEILTPPGHLHVWDEFQNGPSPYTGNGVLVNSGEFDGMESQEAKEKIAKAVGGEMKTTYKLRDWSISRQRYWGAPIPIVYDPDGNAHVVPDEHLPWLLPEDVDFRPTGEAPLAKSKELKDRTEKIFGEGWTPEVDTMDTFVCSSWYFLRYPDPHNDKEFCRKNRLEHWLPVDLYVGGAEHTYLHLMYARFFTKAMQKIGLLDFDEPFLKLRHQGMVLDEHSVKMSKSKGNIVNPDDMVERFGADAVRMYMMFAAPLADEILWNENGIVGTIRFLEKIWRLQEKISEKHNAGVERTLHKLIRKVGDDIEQLKFNTAIAAMMSFINEADKKSLTKKQYVVFIRLLAPFAPHITEELWEINGEEGSIHTQKWPQFNEVLATDEEVTIAVQINGKVRGSVVVGIDANESTVLRIVENEKKLTRWLEGKPRKVIFVPNRLINLVV
jgi:leucyl-tRNA synthetase